MMTRGDRDQVWQQIMLSTDAIESAALVNDWDSVNELLQERKTLLKQFFSEPLASQHQQQLARLQQDIQHILDSDAATLDRGLHSKDVVAKQLSTLKTGKRARAAYIDTN